jgi:hypothetical protein
MDASSACFGSLNLFDEKESDDSFSPRPRNWPFQSGRGHIHLDTFDFQARGFYEKYVFQVFGTIEDYPIWHKRYYLIKILGPNFSGSRTGSSPA